MLKNRQAKAASLYSSTKQSSATPSQFNKTATAMPKINVKASPTNQRFGHTQNAFSPQPERGFLSPSNNGQAGIL